MVICVATGTKNNSILKLESRFSQRNKASNPLQTLGVRSGGHIGHERAAATRDRVHGGAVPAGPPPSAAANARDAAATAAVEPPVALPPPPAVALPSPAADRSASLGPKQQQLAARRPGRGRVDRRD